MVFTNIQPFPIQMSPLSNVTPFTYRDGQTFQEKLELMRVWLNSSLVPDTDAAIANAIDEFQTGITNAEQTVLAAKAGWQGNWDQWTAEKEAVYLAFTTDINTAFDTFKTTVNANFTSFTNSVNQNMTDATQDIEATKTDWQTKWDAFIDNVEMELAALSDSAMGGLINDATSQTGIALRNRFAKKNSLAYNVQDFMPVGWTPADDALAGFKAAVTAMPKGATLWIEPLPVGQYYQLSAPWTIDKPITVKGSVSQTRGAGGGLYGSVLKATTQAVQTAATGGLVQLTEGFVRVEDIGLLGHGIPYGGVGLMFAGGAQGGWTPETGNLGGDTASHGSGIKGIYSIQFGTGVSFGSDSDHNYIDNCVISGNNYGLRIDGGNRFDYMISKTDLTGNTIASVYLPADSNTVNVTFIRCHLGFSNYGILQENPTTAGWGINGLTLLDSPIESVDNQHIKLNTAGNVRIEGGYWVWKTNQPANAALEIYQLSGGPLWFNPRLERNFPNPNAGSVIKITGYTTYPIYIDGDLGSFAPKWINYGASLDITKVFVQGLPYGGQAKGIKAVTVTQPIGTDQDILGVTPVDHGLFTVRAFMKVTTACNVTLKIQYNNGTNPVTQTLVNNQALAVGDYSYVYFGNCYTFNAIVVKAQASVTPGVAVSASIIPERGN